MHNQVSLHNQRKDTDVTQDTAKGTQAISPSEEVFAKILVAVILGKVRPNAHRGEPPFLQKFRSLALQLRRETSTEALNAFFEDWRPALHVYLDALFDALTGFAESEATVAKLSGLPIPQRLVIERLVATQTGRGDRHGRWADELWELKNWLIATTDSSPSGLTLEQVRVGFDSIAHRALNLLLDNRQLLMGS